MAKDRKTKIVETAGQAFDTVRRVVLLPWVGLPLLFVITAGLGFSLGAWKNLCADCPSIAQIHTWEPQQTSKLFSHDGRLIGELGIERRTPVSIHALPEHVPEAFIAIEDRRFYGHSGVDFRGTARAALGVLISGSFSGGGGSTITQQLARNMFETIGFEKRVERKLKELQVALELERAYSKDQILEAYMNQIYLAHGWWGIHTAARNFFGKEATELNPAEAAMLAAVANRPGHYSPFSNQDAARQRRNLVLSRMEREGFLTPQETQEWQTYPLPTERADVTEGLGLYFQEWVRQILAERFPGQVNTGGLRVYTTMDVEMQRAAEQAMERGFDRIESKPGFRHPKYEEFADQRQALEGSDSPYLQGALVALDPGTGEVRAMVGGRDYIQSRFNRANQARRQPGSAFKAFVYGAAIRNGIPASRIITDAPVVRTESDGSEWRPQNFGGEFSGDITLRDAFRRSINMVAIRLADEVGIETVAQTAHSLGIASPLPRVPSLAIGSADVLPIEMAEAYSAFANSGVRVRPYPILRVENAEGEVLWEPQPERARILDPLSNRVMVSLMEDVVDGGTANLAVRSVAGLPYEVPAAGKTGTTNNSTDVWFVGFTPTLQASVWFGMDRPAQIYPGATGGGDAAPVWGEFMKQVYIGEEAENGTEGTEPILPIPERWSLDGLISLQVDNLTGDLASPWCPADRRYTEVFVPGTEPTEECDETQQGRTRTWPW
ncbi:MAG: PBP1A family penicillin-binding protein [Gemmatimonadota bacterium]